MSATQTRSPHLQPSDLALLARLGLADEILSSRSLLEREDDWDDMGSPGYAEATWNRAVDLLVRLATRLRDAYDIRLTSVEIMPGSYGNIDLELRTARARLLLSVPPSHAAPARYYAHDETKTRVVKGTLDTAASNTWLLEWLAE